jgi:uncharacterized membrane protein
MLSLLNGLERSHQSSTLVNIHLLATNQLFTDSKIYQTILPSLLIKLKPHLLYQYMPPNIFLGIIKIPIILVQSLATLI